MSSFQSRFLCLLSWILKTIPHHNLADHKCWRQILLIEPWPKQFCCDVILSFNFLICILCLALPGKRNCNRAGVSWVLQKLQMVSAVELWLAPHALLPDEKLFYCWIHVLSGIFFSWQTFHWILLHQKKTVTVSVDKQFCITQKRTRNFQKYFFTFFFKLIWNIVIQESHRSKVQKYWVSKHFTYHSIHHLLKMTAFHISSIRAKTLFFLSQEDAIIVFSQFFVFPIHFVQGKWSKVQKESETSRRVDLLLW